MPTMLYSDPTSIYSPAFEFDADLTWEETHAYEATRRPIEARGDVSDYVSAQPMECTLDGLVTAMHTGLGASKPQKLQAAKDALVQLADRQQLVLVVSELFVGQLAIVEAAISKSREDGRSFRASLKLQMMDIVGVASAQIPDAVLRRKLAPKQQGASAQRPATEAEKGKTKSWAASIADRYRSR